ncbi:MAG: hypothetical protein IPL31_04720 [Saprospiraceae bacterium]|nr:hypothetical protein [Saprospiraceae bacterium]
MNGKDAGIGALTITKIDQFEYQIKTKAGIQKLGHCCHDRHKLLTGWEETGTPNQKTLYIS